MVVVRAVVRRKQGVDPCLGYTLAVEIAVQSVLGYANSDRLHERVIVTLFSVYGIESSIRRHTIVITVIGRRDGISLRIQRPIHEFERVGTDRNFLRTIADRVAGITGIAISGTEERQNLVVVFIIHCFAAETLVIIELRMVNHLFGVLIDNIVLRVTCGDDLLSVFTVKIKLRQRRRIRRDAIRVDIILTRSVVQPDIDLLELVVIINGAVSESLRV